MRDWTPPRAPTALEWQHRLTYFGLAVLLVAAFLTGLLTDYGIQRRPASEDTGRTPTLAASEVQTNEHPNIEGPR